MQYNGGNFVHSKWSEKDSNLFGKGIGVEEESTKDT